MVWFIAVAIIIAVGIGTGAISFFWGVISFAALTIGLPLLIIVGFMLFLLCTAAVMWAIDRF